MQEGWHVPGRQRVEDGYIRLHHVPPRFEALAPDRFRTVLEPTGWALAQADFLVRRQREAVQFPPAALRKRRECEVRSAGRSVSSPSSHAIAKSRAPCGPIPNTTVKAAATSTICWSTASLLGRPLPGLAPPRGRFPFGALFAICVIAKPLCFRRRGPRPGRPPPIEHEVRAEGASNSLFPVNRRTLSVLFLKSFDRGVEIFGPYMEPRAPLARNDLDDVRQRLRPAPAPLGHSHKAKAARFMKSVLRRRAANPSERTDLVEVEFASDPNAEPRARSRPEPRPPRS